MFTHFPTIARRICMRPLSFVLAALIGLAAIFVGPSQSTTLAQGTVPSAPSWLEPRGLSIVDLVGVVPESHLEGSIISYHVGVGLLQYISGTREGNTVRITASVTPRYGPTWTTIGCLGAWPVFDQWPSAAPAATLKVYANGRDVTSRVIQVKYFPSGLVQPARGANDIRYDMTQTSPMYQVPQPVRIPSNMGCEILVDGGRYTNVTAVFTMNAPQRISVEVLGSQSWTAHSYIGQGASGILSGLAGQMAGRFGDRHEKFAINAPAGADYFILNYPPTPVDPYYPDQDPVNLPLAGSGTYRLERNSGGLSVDHVATMGLPLSGQWQDSDQAGGDFLPFIRPMTRLGVPEYFLPPGVPFQPCMSSGNCSGDVLERVYAAGYNISAYYYRIQRLSSNGLERVELRQVGKGFAAAATRLEEAEAAFAAAEATSIYPVDLPSALVEPAQEDNMIWLPLVSNPPEATPPVTDDPSGCPCGFFDAQGRMVDFIAPAE